MKTDQRQSLKEIMNSMEGVELKEKHGGKFHFRLHMNEQMRNAPLEALELGQRSYNCLKRAGYGTVGELTDAIAGGKELKEIRNCGAKSVKEIMEQLFLFQYHSLRPERREDYLLEIIRLNVQKPLMENNVQETLMDTAEEIKMAKCRVWVRNPL